ncbi:hypothetical protein BH23BAC1_BH23BAC1_15980 [soil metagenome]
MVNKSFICFKENLSRGILISFLIACSIVFPDHAGSSYTSLHRSAQTELAHQYRDDTVEIINIYQVFEAVKGSSIVDTAGYKNLIAKNFKRLIKVKFHQISRLLQSLIFKGFYLPDKTIPQSSPEYLVFIL